MVELKRRLTKTIERRKTFLIRVELEDYKKMFKIVQKLKNSFSLLHDNFAVLFFGLGVAVDVMMIAMDCVQFGR